MWDKLMETLCIFRGEWQMVPMSLLSAKSSWAWAAAPYFAVPAGHAWPARCCVRTVPKDQESLDGPIHLLIGMDHVDNALGEQERSKNLVLYRSVFRSGYMVCGNKVQHEEDRQGAVCMPRTRPLKVLSC
jgi:hypothetical protein